MFEILQNDEMLAELSRQQQSQQRRLTKLQAKLDELCEDLRLDHLITSTKELALEDKNQKPTSKNAAQQPKATLKSFDNDPQFAEILKNMSRLSIKKNVGFAFACLASVYCFLGAILIS